MSYYDQFEVKTRQTGKPFVCVKDDAKDAEELGELVHEIHKFSFGGSWPDDWIYDKIHDAFDFLEDCETEDDYARVRSEIECDFMTSDLLEWGKSGWAQAWIEEGVAELGSPGTFDGIISNGQYLAISAIYQHVWEFLKEKREGGEDEKV